MTGTPGAGPIRLSVHNRIADAADMWREFEKEADCTAFQTYAWHSAWQMHVGDPTGVRPAVVVGRVADRVVFIMPLAVERGRIARRLVWHASALCDYNAPLLDPDFANVVAAGDFPAMFDRVLAAVAAEPGLGYDAVALVKMPELVGSRRNPFLELATTNNPSGAYRTRLSRTWDDFYSAKRSTSTRARDRNKRKHLAALGPLAFVTATGPATEAALTALFQQKSAAFARMGVPDIFARPGYTAFFRAVAADPDNRDFVHVSRLDLGDIPAAVNLALVFRGVYYHVLASYDDGPMARFGPGAAHLHEMIAYAIARGCTTFDFTIGDEPYKREWSDTTLTLHDWRRAATWRGEIVTVPSIASARVKRAIKQAPVLLALAMRARRFAAVVTGRSRGSRSAARADGDRRETG